jgi:hypothetical protein
MEILTHLVLSKKKRGVGVGLHKLKSQVTLASGIIGVIDQSNKIHVLSISGFYFSFFCPQSWVSHGSKIWEEGKSCSQNTPVKLSMSLIG